MYLNSSCYNQIYLVTFIVQDEQLIYPSSLENEKFTVAIVNCQMRINGSERHLPIHGVDKNLWEITSASKS